MKPTIPSLFALLLLGATTAVDAQVGHSDSLLNPNLATAEDLTGVQGLTPALVDAIVEARPLLRPADLHQLLGAALEGEQLDGVYGRLWLPLDLNTASREEILLIPGVGPRIAHEFEEYRPYLALAQFRREIGKYVDDDEVERLASYVYVPVDLNEASRDDILTIPGVGARLAHEFEEYRPYAAIEQFRREIGKYVDDDEVARLERYVRLAP